MIRPSQPPNPPASMWVSKCIVCCCNRPTIKKQLDTWSAALILYAAVCEKAHTIEKACKIFKQPVQFSCGPHLVYWYNLVLKYTKELIDLPFVDPKFAVALRDVRILFNARFPEKEEFSMVQSKKVETAILKFIPQFKRAIKGFAATFVTKYKLLEQSPSSLGLLTFAPHQPNFGLGGAVPAPVPDMKPPVSSESSQRKAPRKKQFPVKIVNPESPGVFTPNVVEPPSPVIPVDTNLENSSEASLGVRVDQILKNAQPGMTKDDVEVQEMSIAQERRVIQMLKEAREAQNQESAAIEKTRAEYRELRAKGDAQNKENAANENALAEERREGEKKTPEEMTGQARRRFPNRTKTPTATDDRTAPPALAALKTKTVASTPTIASAASAPTVQTYPSSPIAPNDPAASMAGIAGTAQSGPIASKTPVASKAPIAKNPGPVRIPPTDATDQIFENQPNARIANNNNENPKIALEGSSSLEVFSASISPAALSLKSSSSATFAQDDQDLESIDSDPPRSTPDDCREVHTVQQILDRLWNTQAEDQSVPVALDHGVSKPPKQKRRNNNRRSRDPEMSPEDLPPMKTIRVWSACQYIYVNVPDVQDN